MQAVGHCSGCVPRQGCGHLGWEEQGLPGGGAADRCAFPWVSRAPRDGAWDEQEVSGSGRSVGAGVGHGQAQQEHASSSWAVRHPGHEGGGGRPHLRIISWLHTTAKVVLMSY